MYLPSFERGLVPSRQSVRASGMRCRTFVVAHHASKIVSGFQIARGIGKVEYCMGRRVAAVPLRVLINSILVTAL